MHIHDLTLCRKFELIPIIIGFFINFLSCSKIGPKTVHGNWPNFRATLKIHTNPLISSKSTHCKFSKIQCTIELLVL